jgi:hypothetical protein
MLARRLPLALRPNVAQARAEASSRAVAPRVVDWSFVVAALGAFACLALLVSAC